MTIRVTFISHRTQRRLKEAFFTIAEQFTHYFREQIYAQEGFRPKEIKVVSLDTTEIVGRERKLHLMDVTIATEMGFQRSRLAIKVFDSLEKTLAESRGNQVLRYILGDNKEIRTPQLLYYSKEYKILVYEGLYAETFEQAKIPLEEKYFLAGRALATIHGFDLKNIDLQRYYTLLNKVFTSLMDQDVIAKKRLEDLRDRIVTEIEQKLFYSYGGGKYFGDFHSGNIMFTRIKEKIRNFNLKSDYVQVYLIDPEFTEDCTESTCNDRFEDIATFFSKELLQEYVNSGNIKNNRYLIDQFLNGYNSILRKINIGIEDIYPQGSSFELQIILALLVDLLYYVTVEDRGEWLNRAIQARLKLIDFLFTSPLSKKK